MTDQDLDTLHASIRRFSDAWAEGDWATIEAMLSPTYTHTDFAGVSFDRPGWLDYVGRRQGQSTTIDFDALAVRRFGDMAVVNGINDIHWHGGDEDEPNDQRIRFTQVWRRDGDSWIREAFHATPVGRDD